MVGNWMLACFAPFLPVWNPNGQSTIPLSKSTRGEEPSTKLFFLRNADVSDESSSSFHPLTRKDSHRVNPLWAVSSNLAVLEELLPTIREEIAQKEGGEEAWKASSDVLVSELETSPIEAELYLAEAFGWSSWAKASEMLRKYQRPKLPSAESIKEGIQWLREGPLEMDEDKIRNVIVDHPKIYLVEPQTFYRKALGAAPRKYRDAETFKKIHEADPSVLEITFNCDAEGCQSECGNCWVSYENRLPI